LGCVSAIAGYKTKQSLYATLLNITKISSSQVTNVSSVLLSVTHKISSFLHELTGLEFTKYFYVDMISNEQVAKFVADCEKFISHFNAGIPETAAQTKCMVDELIDEGRRLFIKIDKKSYDSRMVSQFLDKLVVLKSKHNDILLTPNGYRVEPVGLLLRGDPGIYKTVLMRRIAILVARVTIPDIWVDSFVEDDKQFIYPLPTDQFWEGYTNKAWIATIDDVFQTRDSITPDSEAKKVINMINTAPFNLRMADVSHKNLTFFNSAFVFATSNIKSFNTLVSVTSPEAVQRRFHFEVYARIAPKYLNQDGSHKLPTRDEHTELPNDLWSFTVEIKNGGSTEIHQDISLIKLCKLLVARRRAHVANLHANIRSEREFVSEILEDCEFENLNRDETLSSHFTNLGKDIKDKLWSQHIDIIVKYKKFDFYHKDFESLNTTMTNFCVYDAEKDWRSPAHFDEIFINYIRSVEEHNNEYKNSSPNLHISHFKETLNSVSQFLKKNGLVILALGAVLIPICYKIYKIFTSVEEYNLEPESVDYSRMNRTKVEYKKIVPLSKINVPHNISPQGLAMDLDLHLLPKFDGLDFGVKNNATDVLAKCVNKYFYIMYLSVGGESSYIKRLGHATNIEGQIFMFPFHFVMLVAKYVEEREIENPEVIFTTTNGKSILRVTLHDFMTKIKTTSSAADSDVCLLKISGAQKLSKGLISNVLTRKDLQNLCRTTSFNAILFGTRAAVNDPNAIFINSSYVTTSLNKGSIKVDAVWSDPGTGYALNNTFMYNTNSGNGDCGSLLVLQDGNYENRVFCGMHVAGGTNFGVSCSYDQESLRETIDATYGKQEVFEKMEHPPYLEQPTLVPQSGLIPRYKISPSFFRASPSRSNLQKSKFHSKLPGSYASVGTLPAKLRSFTNKDGVVIDPGLLSFSKYSLIPPPIDVDKVDQAINSYENLLIAHSKIKTSERGIYDLETVLHHFENLNSIASSTSSGFPMSNNDKTNFKKIYYQAMQDGNAEASQAALASLRKEYDRVVDMYKSNIRPFFVYKQCLKDETLPREKVIIGKTRLFSACPFVLLCLFRSYFGAFISDYFSMNLNVGSAVGVNPYGSDWDSLARRLLKFSDHSSESVIAAGDQGQFDARQWPVIHNAIEEMINRWYGADNPDNKIRTQLYQEIVFSRHVYEDHVYFWHSALPSGNPMTAILNTIYNNVLFRLSWINAGLNIESFNDNVYVCILGDDNIFSVSKPYREQFNELTLPTLMAETGNKYTTELKGEAMYAFRPITDVEFLKRSFIKIEHLNRWVAPLREEAIAEMLNWTQKGREGSQISLDNLVFAIREFSLHGEQKFEYWKKHLLELKQEVFPHMKPHGEIPLKYNLCLDAVLKLKYEF
jgi:hypothetical protein